MTTNRQQELCPETKQLMEYMVRYHQDLLKKIFKEHKKTIDNVGELCYNKVS